jgi:hypothetical protein
MNTTRLDSTINEDLRQALPDAPRGRKWTTVEQGDEVRLELRSRSPFGATIVHVNVPKATGLGGLAEATRGILHSN